MWTLTPDNLERAKIELKGRRSAIEARYAAELKAVDADLEEIDTLERVAHSFSLKHLSATDAALESREPIHAPVEADMAASSLEVELHERAGSAPEAAESQPAPPTEDLPAASHDANTIAELHPAPEEPPVSSDRAPKGSSRWRIRVPSDSEMA